MAEKQTKKRSLTKSKKRPKTAKKQAKRVSKAQAKRPRAKPKPKPKKAAQKKKRNTITKTKRSTKQVKRKFPFMALFLLMVIATLIVPHKSIGSTNDTVMMFPTDTASQASVMYIEKDIHETYEPARWSTYIVVTSYNSVPEQTDDTPFITASGTRTRDGVVASNYLPIGTRVRFPDLFGSKVFIVEDRMNSRYYKRADIWSADINFSRQFGARYLRMEVL